MSNARQLAQAATAPLNFKNRLRNGDMRIDQRNGGGAITISSGNGYPTDGWQAAFTGASVAASMQRVSDGPPGFPLSLKATITTARSASASTDAAYCYQPLEGLNVSDLQFGSANPKTLTLSFWVKSSVTGSFAGFLRATSGAPGSYANRSYVFQYTINAANTWEYKTVTIAGDTVAAINSDNSLGLSILFDLGSGSSVTAPAANVWQSGDFYRVAAGQNLAGILNATWQVTGVQLEVGAVATAFERRPYSVELALCQRYYQTISVTHRFYSTAAGQYGASSAYWAPMRVGPTVTLLQNPSMNVLNTWQIVSPSYNGGRFEISSNAAGDCYGLAGQYGLSAEL